MRAQNCTLIGFVNVNMDKAGEAPLGIIRAYVRMKGDHSELPESDGRTVMTSTVKMIDFERRLMVTQNSLYQF